VLESRRLMAELMILGFDRSTTTIQQALQHVQQFATISGVQIQAGQSRQIPFGKTQATYIAGVLRSTEETVPFEMLLVPSPSGVRGIYLGSAQGDMQRLATVRDQIFKGLRIRGISSEAPRTGNDVPTGTGGHLSFKDPAGTMQLSYPRSFQQNAQALQSFRQNGVNSIQLIAFDQAASADLLVFNFAQAANLAQALQAFERFETGGGGQLKSTGRKEVKVGRFSGTLVSGILRMQNGTVLQWEGIFVPTRAGVRAVTFFAVQHNWAATERSRRVVLDSFKVVR